MDHVRLVSWICAVPRGPGRVDAHIFCVDDVRFCWAEHGMHRSAISPPEYMVSTTAGYKVLLSIVVVNAEVRRNKTWIRCERRQHLLGLAFDDEHRCHTIMMCTITTFVFLRRRARAGFICVQYSGVVLIVQQQCRCCFRGDWLPVVPKMEQQHGTQRKRPVVRTRFTCME